MGKMKLSVVRKQMASEAEQLEDGRWVVTELGPFETADEEAGVEVCSGEEFRKQWEEVGAHCEGVVEPNA